jgi:hypothetical protein
MGVKYLAKNATVKYYFTTFKYKVRYQWPQDYKKTLNVFLKYFPKNVEPLSIVFSQFYIYT